MRKLFIAGVVIFVLGAVLFGVLLLSVLSNPEPALAANTVLRAKQGLYAQPIERTITEGGQITDITISATARNIKIVVSEDAEDISIDYYENHQGETYYLVEDGELIFTLKEKFYFSLDMFTWLIPGYQSYSTVILTVPSITPYNYNLKLTSGNITADDVIAKDMLLQTVSGNIRLNNVVAESGRALLTSGNFTGNGLTANQDWDITVTSGNIIINQAATDALKLISTSGNVVLTDLQTTLLDGKVTSGNITLNGTNADIINFKSTSGNITVSRLDGGIDSYSISAKAVSGNIKLNGQSYHKTLMINADKDKTLTINITSGNIKILS